MTLSEFNDYFKQNAMHETIYDDSEGRRIVVIRMLDLYALMNGMKNDMAIPPKADTQRSQGT